MHSGSGSGGGGGGGGGGERSALRGWWRSADGIESEGGGEGRRTLVLAWAKPDQQPPQPPPPRNTSHSTLPTVLVVDRVCEVEVVRCFVSPRRQVWWLRGEWARTLSEARAAAAAAGETEEAEGGEQSQPPLVELVRGRNIFGEAAVEVELSFLYGEEDGDSDDDEDGGGLVG